MIGPTEKICVWGKSGRLFLNIMLITYTGIVIWLIKDESIELYNKLIKALTVMP